MKKEKQQISLQDFQSAKNSVEGRLSRLKRTSRGYWSKSGKSPINRIGVFGLKLIRWKAY